MLPKQEDGSQKEEYDQKDEMPPNEDMDHKEETLNYIVDDYKTLSPGLDFLSIIGEWLFFFQCFSALYESADYPSEENLLDDVINIFINPFHFDSDERFELCKLGILFPFICYFIAFRFRHLRPQFLIYVLCYVIVLIILFLGIFVTSYFYYVTHDLHIGIAIPLTVLTCPAFYLLIVLIGI